MFTKNRCKRSHSGRLTPLSRLAPARSCSAPHHGLPRPAPHWPHRQESRPVSLARTASPIWSGPSLLPAPGASEPLAALSTSPLEVPSETTPVTRASLLLVTLCPPAPPLAPCHESAHFFCAVFGAGPTSCPQLGVPPGGLCTGLEQVPQTTPQCTGVRTEGAALPSEASSAVKAEG